MAAGGNTGLGSPKFLPMELLDSLSDGGMKLFRFRRLLPFCFISLSVEIASPKKDPLRGSQISPRCCKERLTPSFLSYRNFDSLFRVVVMSSPVMVQSSVVG